MAEAGSNDDHFETAPGALGFEVALGAVGIGKECFAQSQKVAGFIVAIGVSAVL